ncbi:DUF397 domain-containing protein [Streptoalloteichus hindustanus]|uniref:DUF397 domain-containing protein n=1 Tax=Streptoalloteichus hindustanus TaxID=2017 RepID=UPI000936C740|nr:DUF397 domain-containing protein [Streptoalloteichus hindustanus]
MSRPATTLFWRTSSRSSDGSNCVEVAGWRKSSHSSNGESCVEAGSSADLVLTADSKNPGGPALSFHRAEWGKFVSVLRSGQLDLT